MTCLATLALLFAAQQPTEEELLEEMLQLGQAAEELSTELPPEAPRQFLDAFIAIPDESGRNNLIGVLLESEDPRANRLLRDTLGKNSLSVKDRFTLAEAISKRNNFDLTDTWAALAREAPAPLLRLRALEHYRKTGAEDLTDLVVESLDAADLEKDDIRAAVQALADSGSPAAERLLAPPDPPAPRPLPAPLPDIEPEEEEEETTPAGKRKHPRKRTRTIPESEKPSPPSTLKRNLVVLAAAVFAGILILLIRRRP